MSARFEGKADVGKSLEFNDFKYKTSNEEEQEFIEHLPNFGHEYWLLTEGAPIPKDTEPKPEVKVNYDKNETMDRKIASMEATINSIGASVEKLAGIVMGQLADKTDETVDEDQPEAPEEDKKDSKEDKKKDDKKTNKNK